ncbi:predicted protein [Histoplasma capsulatum G186AR]|uniref:Uncharacterized protein n=1 Tax=Ajellomyces capsulatus (strain G186AR / H82 / ATCC MYA-2454 / RMSCC 2432) TaxID=447093 RepID=C0NU98_AJECG|nr:uncharacterized protein HCBG_06929 [Histoplasma capsulatum G186AR]EEH04978.1 predicted protein [Histoplasma capsulatum G186AR]
MDNIEAAAGRIHCEFQGGWENKCLHKDADGSNRGYRHEMNYIPRAPQRIGFKILGLSSQSQCFGPELSNEKDHDEKGRPEEEKGACKFMSGQWATNQCGLNAGERFGEVPEARATATATTGTGNHGTVAGPPRGDLGLRMLTCSLRISVSAIVSGIG